jgi:predicted nucleic acid-binding Zn finger protein
MSVPVLEPDVLDLLDLLCMKYLEEGHRFEDRDENDANLLRNLAFIFSNHRKLLESAIEIIDDKDNAMKRFISSTSPNRQFWKVKGSSNQEYLCLARYCPCPSYFQQARLLLPRPFCKHLLAITISRALNREEITTLSNEEFAKAISNEPKVLQA